MSMEPAQALRDILTQESDAILQNRGRLASLLNDACPSYASQRRLLDAAVEHRVAHDLAIGRRTPLGAAERAQLIGRMAIQSMLQEGHCAWAVDAWAWALDRSDGAQPTAAGPAPSIVFTSSPTSIEQGDEVVLSWRVTDAETVTLLPQGQEVPPTRELRDNPSKSTKYVIRAQRGDQTAEASVYVHVIQVATRQGPRLWTAATLLGLAVMLVAGWLWRFEPGAIDVTVEADRQRLDRPGTVVFSWTAPAGVRFDITPDGDCERRESHILCSVDTSRLFVLTAWDGKRRVTERRIEVTVAGSARE